jgi:uncharacterized protein (UPF0264 family)
MRVVAEGTIDLFQVQQNNAVDLSLVQQAIKDLVNARPFGEHTEQDLIDYVNLRHQEELLKALL